MLRKLLLALLAAGVFSSVAWAQATQPSEPAAATAAGEQAPTLPKGHPPLEGMGGKMGGALPEGHPPIGEGGPGGGMPEGHPPIGPEEPMPATPYVANLAIQAVQGTAGGPAPAGEDVTVEFFDGRQIIKTLQAKLDDHGVVTLEKVDLDYPVRPMVTVRHAGVDYQADGEVLDPDNTQGRVDVKVYETTDTEPAWTLVMRHVLVQTSPHGLHVLEVMAVENPGDRAWLGKPTEDGQKETVVFQIPTGLEGVQLLGGFHDCCTQLTAGRLSSRMPLLPGTVQYRISYMLPVKDQKAVLKLSSQVATERFMLVAPDDGSTITAQKLQAAGAIKMGAKSSRMFKAEQIPAAEEIVISIEGLPESTQPMPGQPPAGDQAADMGPMPAGAAEAGPVATTAVQGQSKLIAAIGGGVAVLAGLAMLLVKSPRKAA
ncbi:MAG: hypothetical protein IT443_00975 [Phycisphaeraceae bacterium]|nr:hypothetical protein [Phycisphaeraceae bacterium]